MTLHNKVAKLPYSSPLKTILLRLGSMWAKFFSSFTYYLDKECPTIKKKSHKPKRNILPADFSFIIFSISDTMTQYFLK